jgi:predicted ester cyclase
MLAKGQRPDHDSIRQMWVDLLTVFPDLHIEPQFWRHGDDHIFVEVRVSGTQKADWAGIPAHGGSIDTRMAALYEFEGDQLVCERVYLDFAEIARQLGAA